MKTMSLDLVELQDNRQLRSLFSLPPLKESVSTALTVPELPPKKVVTGDHEIDAVLWLQQVVNTGQPGLIAKAMEAAKFIKTPMKDLGSRYGQYLMRESKGNTMAVVFGSMGFGELQCQAEHAINRLSKEHEALSYFGTIENLFNDTSAEAECVAALRGLKRDKSSQYEYIAPLAKERFLKRPALVPHTLADCIHVREWWAKLYWLRQPFGSGDAHPAGQAHDNYCFAMLANIPARTTAEALAVLGHLEQEDAMDRKETSAILRNLIAGTTRDSPLHQQQAAHLTDP